MSEECLLPTSWSSISVSKAVSNLPLTGKKIPQKQYLEIGKYPIVDQGKSMIGGYSDDDEALVDCSPPVIVFGDHTKVVKLVRFRFAPGADGIKVLKPHEFFDCVLFKYFLDYITAGLIDKGYARHYQHLANSKVHLPPSAEQLRIVAKIDELFSELDAGVVNLKKARAQLAVYRQALLKHAFEGKLTAEWRSLHRPLATVHSEIPHPVESWRFTTLGNLTEYITSGSRGWAEYYADSGPIFIRAANLNRDRLDLSEVAFVSLPAGVEGTRTQTRLGDVFITITGANVTKAGYLDREIGEAYVSQHVALCRPIDPTISEYLYLYIISNAGGRRDLEKAAYGAGKPGLNLDNLRTLRIPMPTRAEMPEIVAAIRSQLSEIDALEADIDLNLQKTEALRQSILQKAFAGELVPQDPADEPAAALLARIRAEREAQAAAAAVAKTGKPRKIKVP